MPRLPDNLPALLRAVGLTVVVVGGYPDRGRPGPFARAGVLNHHTGASARGWSRAKELAYAKWMFLTGRSDLRPPLCQIALGRSGVVYLGAAGRANHAGTAKASGSVAGGDGNSLYIGIEWMLSGSEAIPVHMMKAGILLNAVLTEKVTGNSVNTISCHYQTSVTGKWDIGDPNGVPFKGHRVLNVNSLRASVKATRAALYAPKKAAPKPSKAAKKPGKHTRTIVFWNAYIGQTGKQIMADLDYIKKRHDPDKIGLLEVSDEIPELSRWAKDNGYRLLVGKRAKGNKQVQEESQSSVMLVRSRLNLYSWVPFKMSKWWTGPKHRLRRPGRTFIADVAGGIRSVVVHMPTPQGNKAAYDETLDRLAKVASNRASRVRPLVMGPDWNKSNTSDEIKAFAKRIGAQVIADENGVDYVLFRGTGKKGKRLATARVFTGTKRGSDHFYIVVRLYWK